MKSFFVRYFRESMIGAIVFITIIMLVGLLYLIPYLTKEQLKQDAFKESERLVSTIKLYRAYYANNILNKINAHSDLKVNFDHKTSDDTVPLPATLVHDMGELFTANTDTKVQMYSAFPFPNREDRVLDKFQNEALSFLLKNPQQVYSREDTVDGKLIYRSAFPDSLSKPSCVGCHNARLDTPKDDWKLGDLRGAIEVDMPIDSFSITEDEFTTNILLFIMFNFSFIVVYYLLFISRKNRELEDTSTTNVQLLSEYKRAVDMGAIVSKTDTKGIITYANESFIDISGYTKDELIGKSQNIVRHPNTPKETFEDLWSTILAKKVWQGDLKNRSKDGSDYYVFATIVPILNVDNEIVEFIAIRYDTTDLHEALDKAYKAEKAKSRFLANMSHELRTPLNAIIGFSQILQRKDSLEEKEKKYIDKIHLSGGNLLTLVNSILDFSKMDENEMEYNPSDVNIEELFSEVLIMLETTAKENRVAIDMFKHDTPLIIEADEQLLKQAFINILSNAIKFSDRDAEVKVAYEKRDSQHIFSVCDTGHGMDESELQEIFTPFKQGESASKSAIKGTGLGMAITHKIITELHGGEIKVESKLGEGTCFYILLNS